MFGEEEFKRPTFECPFLILELYCHEEPTSLLRSPMGTGRGWGWMSCPRQSLICFPKYKKLSNAKSQLFGSKKLISPQLLISGYRTKIRINEYFS